MGQITGRFSANKRGQRSIDPLIMAKNTNKYGNTANSCQFRVNLPPIHQQMRAALPQLRCFLNWRGGGRAVFAARGVLMDYASQKIS